MLPHPALRPKAPPVAVEEAVLEVLVGFLEAEDEVKDGVDDDGLVWESDGRGARGAVDCPAISA